MFSDNSIIMRSYNNQNIIDAMKYWFSLVEQFSGRDQISLPAVRSIYKLKEYFFDFSPRTKKNGYFAVLPHKVKQSSSNLNRVLNFFIIFYSKRIFYYFFVHLKKFISK